MGATATMGVRFTPEERRWVSDYAAFRGTSVSEVIRESVFEAIEDELDSSAFAAALAEDDGKVFSLRDVMEELGDL